jgi:hypothetical protein
MMRCTCFYLAHKSYGLGQKGTHTERFISLLSSGYSKSVFQLAVFVFYPFKLRKNTPVFHLQCNSTCVIVHCMFVVAWTPYCVCIGSLDLRPIS